MLDLALTSEQAQLCASVHALLTQHCSPARVRSVQHLGHDPDLWCRVRDLGVVEMSVENSGDASLVDIALVCELAGQFVAPIPLVESVVAARLLARLRGVAGDDVAGDDVAGDVTVLALHPPCHGVLHSVPGGAVATMVIFAEGDTVRMTTDGPPGVSIPNLGSLALSDRSTDRSRLIARGDDIPRLFAQAQLEWRILVSALLCGVAGQALALAVAYAQQRHAFGVPIATYQVLAHRLAEVATDIDGAGLLARKAAWAQGADNHESAALACMAYLIATETSRRATRDCLHVFGGYGFALEYDIQLYYRAAKAWGLLLGDVAREPELLADVLWGGGVRDGLRAR